MYAYRKIANDESQGNQFGLASPADRIAAGILDCSVLIPLVQLVQSPIRRWIFESVLFDNGAQISTYRVINLILFVAIFVIYYSLMIYWRGQTLGKYFLKIQVISYHGKISLAASFLRSFSLFTQFIFLAYPFLALWTHPLRRPIHDRLADTLVVSSNSQEGLSKVTHSFKLRLAFAFVFLLFISVGFFSKPKSDLREELDFLIAEECASFKEKTLNEMVELFLVKKIDSNCLEAKGKESIWLNEDSVLAHFAVALAAGNNSQKSDQYLTESCPKEEEYPDEMCLFIDWLFQPSLGTVDDPGSVLSLAHREGTFDFIKILVSAHLRMDRRYLEMEPLLKQISKKSALKTLHLKLSFHSLLGQNKISEAYWLMKSSRLVNEDDLLLFLNFELEKEGSHRRDLLSLVETFFPQLNESIYGRGLASEDADSEIIQEVYYKIKEGL